eukprot:scaffold125191_cov39-Phaeocystis_antarctica.AAC.1
MTAGHSTGSASAAATERGRSVFASVVAAFFSAAARACSKLASPEATSLSDTPACFAAVRASSSRVAFATWNGSGIAAPSKRSAALTLVALAAAGLAPADFAPLAPVLTAAALLGAPALAFATGFGFAFGAAAAAAAAATASSSRSSAAATSVLDTPARLAATMAGSSRAASPTWNGSGIAAPSKRSAAFTSAAASPDFDATAASFDATLSFDATSASTFFWAAALLAASAAARDAASRPAATSSALAALRLLPSCRSVHTDSAFGSDVACPSLIIEMSSRSLGACSRPTTNARAL